eukprot:11210648-Lingulodinium_polyedra.AAC.1
MARAWSARACDLKAVAATKRRFDCTVVQRFTDVAQRCVLIEVLLPQRPANRMLARSMSRPKTGRGA